MPSSSASSVLRIDGPVILRGLALVVVAVGIGVWGALLFAPATYVLPPMLSSEPNSAQDTHAVAGWFGGTALRVRVTVKGLIISGDGHGAALLAVNGGPARAYRVGQALAPGVTLAGIGSKTVSVDQDGIVEALPVPVVSSRALQGFVPVPPPG